MQSALDGETWSVLCPEVILHILRSPELIGLASRLCRQWRHTATLVTSTEPTAFGSDAELRRFCVACPLLRTLRIDGDARITDAGGEAVSVLRCLIEFSLHGWGSTAERTLASLGKLHTLTSIDLSWCAMISDRAILNLALGRLPALRFLCMRGCRRVGDAAVAELLRASTDLTSLDVSFCSRLGDSTVRALSSMQHMHTLSMRSLAQVTTDSLPAIASLRSLTELDVSYCPEVSGEGVTDWTQLTALRVVAMSGCSGISAYWVSRLLTAWTALETLDLFNIPHLTDLAVTYALPGLTRLRCLDLSHNPLLTSRCIAQLSALRQLTDLSASGLPGVQPESFAVLLRLTRLRALGLHNNRGLPRHLLTQMSRLLTNLTQLGMRHCCSQHEDDGEQCASEFLSGLRRSMRHLDLSYSKLGPAPHLSHLESLESLHLSGCCDVTDEAIARIARLPNLHSLDLSRCHHVTDDGLALLASVTRLATLQLHGCALITDRGIRAVAELPNLETLDVSECAVGDEGLCSLATPALRFLNALSCKGAVRDASIRHIATALTALTSLHVQLSDVESTDSVALFSRLRALQHLDLAKFSAGLLEGLAHATSLKALIVAGVTGSRGFASLGSLELESLQVLRCPDVDPADLVEGLAQCDRLCYLSVLDCPHVTASSLTPLGRRAPTLQELAISAYYESPTSVLDTLHAHFPTAALTVYADGLEVGHA